MSHVANDSMLDPNQVRTCFEQFLVKVASVNTEDHSLVLDKLRFAFDETIEGIKSAAVQTRVKQYGNYHILYEGSESAVAVAEINAEHAMSFHTHEIRQEMLFVKRGVLSVRGQIEIKDYPQGESTETKPGVAHQLHNRNTEKVEVIELVLPPLWSDKVVLEQGY